MSRKKPRVKNSTFTPFKKKVRLEKKKNKDIYGNQ